MVGDSRFQSTARSQPQCQIQTGSEFREDKAALDLWLWFSIHSASCARMTDVSCFWKMKYLSFYDSSVIPAVPCQDSVFPASFLRRGQHVSCLCHFKYSLMPSVFSGHFMKKTSLVFPPVPHCKAYCSASNPPSFCPAGFTYTAKSLVQALR